LSHSSTDTNAGSCGRRCDIDAYVDPELIGGALGGQPLPFVPDPVHDRPPAWLVALLDDIDEPMSDLARTEAAAYLADILVRLGDRRVSAARSFDVKAVPS
jgi:hypothetical protein